MQIANFLNMIGFSLLSSLIDFLIPAGDRRVAAIPSNHPRADYRGGHQGHCGTHASSEGS
jgi:hypothetical protein